MQVIKWAADGKLKNELIYIVLLQNGKTNQHGNVQYGAFLRHREPEICCAAALAQWFFIRWHIRVESFPDFRTSEAWFDIKAIRSFGGPKTSSITYKAHRDLIARVMEGLNLTIPKNSHRKIRRDSSSIEYWGQYLRNQIAGSVEQDGSRRRLHASDSDQLDNDPSRIF